MKTNYLSLGFGVLLAALTGCDNSAPSPVSAPTATTNITEQIFEVHGVVRSLPETGHSLVVRHDEIPNYMPKMTMELNVRDTNELRGLERDDEITFRLIATPDTHWIEHIQKVGKFVETNAPESAAPGFSLVKELQPGDAVPDYEFLAEDGRVVHFSDFRGKAMAFTFVFTRCPLPDFCPRMGNNFAAARSLMLTNANAATNWQFLSISFDPEFDSPEVLRNYARFYRHENADRWLFVAAPQKTLRTLAPELDLMLQKDAGGSISHNLRTVVLDPQGRIHKQFDGNRWTPAELAAELLTAAESK